MGKKSPKKKNLNKEASTDRNKDDEQSDIIFYRAPKPSQHKETCEYCCQEIKGELIKCKCFYTFFCSESCRKKSIHFKQLCKGGDMKVFPPSEIKDAINDVVHRLKLSNTEEERNLRSELGQVAGKSYDELLCNSDNPSALYVLGMSWEKNVNMKHSTPLLVALPEDFSKQDELKRKRKAVNYLIKSCEAGNLLSAYTLFCDSGTQAFDCTMPISSPRLTMECLAGCLQRGVKAKDVRERINFHSQILGALDHFMTNVRMQARVLGFRRMPDNRLASPFNMFNRGSRLGYLILSRCIEYLASSCPHNLKENLDLSNDDFCLEELVIFVKFFSDSDRLPTFIPCIAMREEFIKDIIIPTSVRYVQPSFDEEATMKDLGRVTEGLQDLDSTKRARYDCSHWSNQRSPINDFPVPKKVCRGCFMTGMNRVRAVASQACFLSFDRINQRDNNIVFGVIYQEDNYGKKMFEVYHQSCKEEVSTALKLLFLHSADIDPRMICLNLDLYWSIIWYYGSVTEALRQVGGERMLSKAFGPHDQFTEMELKYSSPLSYLDNSMGSYHGINFSRATDEYVNNRVNIEVPYLYENNFAEKFKKKKEQRYRCSFSGCLELEDDSKFLNCGGCVKLFKRKYCSVECQEKDWDHHHKFCGEKLNNYTPPRELLR